MTRRRDGSSTVTAPRNRGQGASQQVPTCIVWGRLPPPIGGVTRSTAQQSEHLRSLGWRVQNRSPRRSPLTAIRRLMTEGGEPPVLAIYNLSSWRTMLLAAPSTMNRRCDTVGYLHGGSLGRWLDRPRPGLSTLIRRFLGQFDEVWVTNGEIADILASRYAVTAITVSPHVGPGDDVADRVAAVTRRLVTAAYNAAPLYRLEETVAAANELGRTERDVRLDVLLYGEDEERIEQAAHTLAERCAVPLTVHRDLPPEEVASFLTGGTVLLRLTETDGDSLLVREAIARGARVVATDNVPRPTGVELTAPDPAAVAEAVRHGGVAATGDGLGLACGVHLDRLIAAIEARRSSKP